MTDVLILYEHKNREIENSALLAEELSYRGYKVRIESIYSPWKYFLKPKLLVVPHLYNEEQLIRFAKNIWLKNDKILSLQYEQVQPQGSENLNTDIHYPSGQAKYAHHIAWGDSQMERYLEGGLPPENLHKTGFISMDLLRKEFQSYLKSKEELASEFSIDSQKEWVLFISSFTMVNRSSEEIKEYTKAWTDTPTFAELSNKSYPIIIDWLKRAAHDFPEKVFIYRPHPAEKFDKVLKALESRYSNFRYIESYTMRQWVVVADLSLNWISTSIADLYFAKKPCYLLRPIDIPRSIDMGILSEVKKIESYAELFSTLNQGVYNLMDSNMLLDFFYGGNNGRMSYLKTADVCEKLLSDKLKGYKFDFYMSRFNIANSTNTLNILWEYLKIVIYAILIIFHISNIPFLSNLWKKKLAIYSKDVYGVKGEVVKYRHRFAPIVKTIHHQEVL